jgi:hypothetical protein
LDRETNETLHAYAHFIGETAEYVVNQVIDTVLAKDKEFLQWRATHPQSYVPENPVPRGATGKGLRRTQTVPATSSGR